MAFPAHRLRRRMSAGVAPTTAQIMLRRSVAVREVEEMLEGARMAAATDRRPHDRRIRRLDAPEDGFLIGARSKAFWPLGFYYKA